MAELQRCALSAYTVAVNFKVLVVTCCTPQMHPCIAWADAILCYDGQDCAAAGRGRLVSWCGNGLIIRMNV
jgi:hypothetical protein